MFFACLTPNQLARLRHSVIAVGRKRKRGRGREREGGDMGGREGREVEGGREGEKRLRERKTDTTHRLTEMTGRRKRGTDTKSERQRIPL